MNWLASSSASRKEPELDSPYTIRVIETFDDFEELRKPWNAALADSLDPHPFLTHEWLSTWWRHFGDTAKLRVITVSDSVGFVALAPLSLWRVGKRPMRRSVLRPISHDAGDYGGVIVVARAPDAALPLIKAAGSEVRRAHAILSLPRLARLGASYDVLMTQLGEQKDLAGHELALNGSCWFVDLSHDIDLTRLAKRQKIDQSERRLHKEHTVDVNEYRGSSLTDGIEDFLRLHDLRWHDRLPDVQGLLAGAEGERFLRDVVRSLDSEGWVRLVSLVADGQSIASNLCLEFSSCVYLWKTAFDPAFARYGPGKVLMHSMLEECRQRGVSRFDFLRGNEHYKRQWDSKESPLATVTVARAGVRGKVDLGLLRVASRLERRNLRQNSRETDSPR